MCSRAQQCPVAGIGLTWYGPGVLYLSVSDYVGAVIACSTWARRYPEVTATQLSRFSGGWEMFLAWQYFGVHQGMYIIEPLNVSTWEAIRLYSKYWFMMGIEPKLHISVLLSLTMSVCKKRRNWCGCVDQVLSALDLFLLKLLFCSCQSTPLSCRHCMC